MNSHSDEAPRRGRVVLTHGRMMMSLAAAWSLGRRGVSVIGTDSAPLTALSFSTKVDKTFLHEDADEDEEAFLASLANGVRQHAPDDDRPYLLMPMHRQTELLAANRTRFAPAIVALPEAEAIRATEAKHRLAELARQTGVAIPETVVVGEGDTVEPPQAGPPWIVKPSESHGGRGLAKVEAAEELAAAVATARAECTNGLALIQEAVPGEDYCLTALCDQGKPTVTMCYRNIENMPGEGGFGVLRETVEAGPMPEIAEKLLAPLGWHGIVQLDFRWTGDDADEPRLIEVNPRFFGGLFQAIDSGVDYPWLLYRLFADGVAEPQPPVKIGHRTKVPLLWAASLVDDLVPETVEKLGAAFDQARQTGAREGAWTGLRQFFDSLSAAREKPDKATLSARLEQALDANPEVFNLRDPFASLGILYILGALLRHGKLPEEITRG